MESLKLKPGFESWINQLACDFEQDTGTFLGPSSSSFLEVVGLESLQSSDPGPSACLERKECGRW